MKYEQSVHLLCEAEGCDEELTLRREKDLPPRRIRLRFAAEDRGWIMKSPPDSKELYMFCPKHGDEHPNWTETRR